MYTAPRPPQFWALDPALAPFIILKATIPNGMPPPPAPAPHRALPAPFEGSKAKDDGVVVARSFRVAQRAANAHAHASAAMVARLAPSSVPESPYPMCHAVRLVFAGVSQVRLGWSLGSSVCRSVMCILPSIEPSIDPFLTSTHTNPAPRDHRRPSAPPGPRPP